MGDDSRRDTRADHLTAYRWKPGQHGGGRGRKAYTEDERSALALAKKALPGTVRTLLMVMAQGSNSDKVSAANTLLRLVYPKGIPEDMVVEVEGDSKLTIDLRAATTEQLQVLQGLGVRISEAAQKDATPKGSGGLDS